MCVCVCVCGFVCIFFFCWCERGSLTPDCVFRSPLYSQYQECLEGLETIRAYGLQEMLTEQNHKMVNRFVLPFVPWRFHSLKTFLLYIDLFFLFMKKMCKYGITSL